MNKGVPFYTPAETKFMPMRKRNKHSIERIKLAAQARMDGHSVTAVAKFFGYKSKNSMISCGMNNIGFSFGRAVYVDKNKRLNEEPGSEHSDLWNRVLYGQKLGVMKC